MEKQELITKKEFELLAEEFPKKEAVAAFIEDFNVGTTYSAICGYKYIYVPDRGFSQNETVLNFIENMKDFKRIGDGTGLHPGASGEVHCLIFAVKE